MIESLPNHMHKLTQVFILYCLVFLTSCCTRTTLTIPEQPDAPPEIESAELAEQILRSLIAIRFNEGGEISGSGTLISVDGIPHMITAAHVIRHMILSDQSVKDVACYIETYSKNEDCADIMLGEGYSTLVRIDNGRDVILVPLSHFPAGAEPAETVVPGYEFRVGEEVWVTGCPAGLPNIVTRGIVSGFTQHDRSRIFTDSDTWFGTSGGGIFLSTGEYVGYFHSMLGTRTPNGSEIAEGLNVFSPLPTDWGL